MAKAAITNQGIDLLTSYERLQPAWFHLYLQNPGAFRPRTVMPTSWPGGVAAFKTILDGDTNRQIEAIWYYLSLGTSAADPPGVRAVGTKLVVGETAVVHRGRSRVAGFRGIAVGLPEKMNYAFNAETGTLSAIWEGEFVSVNWSGQGSGDFNPAGPSIQLAQDVSFATLESATAPWPLMPVMTKEAPPIPIRCIPRMSATIPWLLLRQVVHSDVSISKWQRRDRRSNGGERRGRKQNTAKSSEVQFACSAVHLVSRVSRRYPSRKRPCFPYRSLAIIPA